MFGIENLKDTNSIKVQLKLILSLYFQDRYFVEELSGLMIYDEILVVKLIQIWIDRLFVGLKI